VLFLLKKGYYSCRFLLRYYFTKFAFLYRLIAFFRRNPFRVTSEKTVLLDGFPRSANSLCEAAILNSGFSFSSLAHHTHSIGSIKRALDLNLLVVIPFRVPDSVVASNVEMYEGAISTDAVLLGYIMFHRQLYSLIKSLSVERSRNLFLIDFDNIKDDIQFVLFEMFKRGLIVSYPTVNDDYILKSLHDVDRIGSGRNSGVVERYSLSASAEHINQRKQKLKTFGDFCKLSSYYNIAANLHSNIRSLKKSSCGSP